MTVQRIVTRAVTVTLLGFALFGTAACGYVLTQGPPEGHRQMTAFTCSESNTGPILDAVQAGASVFLALLGATSNTDGGGYGAPSSGAMVASGIAVGLAYGVSAGIGFHRTSECRAAMRQWRARQAQGHPSLIEGQLVASVAQAVVVRPPADTLAVGAQLQLVAAAYGSSGAVIPDKPFVWTSSNDAIASVGAAGLVTAHASGSVVIAARADNAVGTASALVVASR